MKLVGLTGGIASGKSAVTRLLREAGVPVVDCDDIAHDVVKKGRWGYNRVVQAFGQEILDSRGEVDREALGKLVFGDRQARKQLNKATHLPIFRELVWQVLRHWCSCHWIVAVDMPLLFETGAYRLFWPRILVYCSPEVQVSRLVARDNCSKEDALARINSQMPLDAKRQKASIVIDNSGSLESTKEQVTHAIAAVKKGSLWQGLMLSPMALASGLLLVSGIGLI